jgi:hypothetical protein
LRESLGADVYWKTSATNEEKIMLDIELDREAGLAILRPERALSEADFDSVAGTIDLYLEEHGELTGLIIFTKEFPGWKSFGAMLKHFRFVRDYQRKLSRVALVTDSKIGNLAEMIAGHFVSASVKHFPHDSFIDARNWVLDAKSGQVSKG